MSKLIEIKDLVTDFYTYEGVVQALNKVSLSIDKGVTFGLVGESGCGKSVTVRSIMRLIQPPGVIESGKIIFYGNDNDNANSSDNYSDSDNDNDSDSDSNTISVDLLQQSEDYMQQLRGDKISMIFQEPNAALNPILSIGDQVSESFLAHRKKHMADKILSRLTSKDDKKLSHIKSFIEVLIKPWLKFVYRVLSKNPDAFIQKFLSKIPLLKAWDKRLKLEAKQLSIEILKKLAIPNASKIYNDYPHNLSGGMKQRIVIAIALACSPVLLIADEATSNLDVTIQAQILELLNTLKNDIISSILLITHDLGVVAETCDRVGVMYAGSLCEVANVKDLFNNPMHPYTKALLDSVPKRDQTGELKTIEGSVPDLVTPPTGCRFHPRCSLAMEKCQQSNPELENRGKNHLTACFATAIHAVVK